MKPVFGQIDKQTGRHTNRQKQTDNLVTDALICLLTPQLPPALVSNIDMI